MGDKFVKLIIHHGGGFHDYRGKRQYVGGHVDVVEDKFDLDHLSYVNVQAYIKERGYTNVGAIWVNHDTVGDFCLVMDDLILCSIAEKVRSGDKLDFYLVGGIKLFSDLSSQVSENRLNQPIENNIIDVIEENIFSQDASSSSTSSRSKYDVFLSFSGADTRHNFTSHLYNAFSVAGICSFIDNQELERGEEIATSLFRSIRASSIGLVIFSQGYAASRWCLDELLDILDCRNKRDMVVLPVFYRVDPSDIQKQRKQVGRDLARHGDNLSSFKIKSYKRALKEASHLSGWDFFNEQGREAGFIQRIVDDILNKCTPAHLSITIYPIGYDTCDDYMNLFLEAGSDDVIMVGICGSSGMCKTAIAKAAYDRISHNFEGSSFLVDVGQQSREVDGLAQLQEKLLADILSINIIKISNVYAGMRMIENQLHHKRVLIVLDNVDGIDQLYALVGSRNWFGAGSKVIITTRNVQLLDLFGVDQIFMAQGRPLPHNIQVIWEEFRRSRHEVAGLMNYIQNFQQQAEEKVRYMEDCLSKEKQKSVEQEKMICELMQKQKRVCA